MTSEGQHAGQPADATPGADGFPPDADDHQQQGATSAAPQTGWGPDAYPNSYGPPPYPPSGAGSPFVVPAVPVFGTPNGDAQVPGSAAGSASVASGSASVPSGSARVPAPPAAAVPPPAAPLSAWAPPARSSAPQPARSSAPQAEPTGHPYRDADAHPYRPAGQSSGSASVPGPPSQFPPASQPPALQPPASAPPAAGQAGPPPQPGFAPGGPLPSRTDRAPFSGPGGPGTPDAPGGFNGFVTPSAGPSGPAGTPSSPGGSGAARRASEPEQRSPGHPQLSEHGSSTGGNRPPGISAFGGQRVRVPGAALSELSDAPPAGGPDAQQDGTGAARQTSNGLPVRGSGPQPAFPAPPGFLAPPAAGQAGTAPPPAYPAQSGPAAFPAPSGPGFDGSGFDGPAVGGPAAFGGQDSSPASGGSGFGSVRGQEPGPSADRGHDSGGYPVRGQASGSFPSRAVEGGSFPVRGQDSGGFAAGAGAGAQTVAPPRTGTDQADPASVPQPRTPAEPSSGSAPAVGTARPVSASASVPVASRVVPADAEELPAASAGPKARVYGRPPQTEQPAQTSPAPPAPFQQPGGFGSPRPGSVSGQPDSDHPVSGRPVSGQPVSGQAGFGQAGPGQPGAQGGAPGFGSRGPGSAPVSGRATASARVTPPPADAAPFMPGVSPAGHGPGPQDDRGGAPYSEHTTDIAGRGRGPGAPGDQFGSQTGNPSGRGNPFPDGGGAPYSEHTTDLAGRGRATDQPYVPAPALPSMHASPPAVDGFPPARPVEQDPGQRPARSGRPQLGGVFPGPGGPGPNTSGALPANRPTVTPPGPAETSSWPGSPGGDQGRFDAFKPDNDAAAVKKADPPANVRMAPVLLAVILVSAVVVGLAIGGVWLISRSSSDASFSVSAGDCVKQDGDKAVEATCGDPGAFQVASIVDTREQCPDPNQPYVLNPSGEGRTQVLCLTPSS